MSQEIQTTLSSKEKSKFIKESNRSTTEANAHCSTAKKD
jgi:hypothetical protein